MDRQVRAERAWRIPYEVALQLGDFRFQTLRTLSQAQIAKLLADRRLHRFPRKMSQCFYEAVHRIDQDYEGHADRVWNDCPTSARLVIRFLAFRGVGLKIATMAANLLVCHFKVPVADYYSIDVSADVHIRRVFERSGFTGPLPSIEEVIYTARELNPEFPGLLDFATWKIGRDWCHPKTPECPQCRMKGPCSFAQRERLDDS